MPLSFLPRLLAPASILVLAALGPVAPALAGDPPAFQLPVDCEPGRTCVIQHYVDHDAGPGTQDYACGNATYDGHDGTDIRLPTTALMRRGVSVRAAATGRVLRVRDGQPDRVGRPSGDTEVEGVECGNGVVIDHGGGWTTQYCHMAQGSVQVKPGDPVTAGQVIGKVGLSGMTQFPHLHFTVREDDRVVDPFASGAPAGACGGGVPLWQKAVAAALPYAPRIVLNGGFTGRVPTMETIESGEVAAEPALPAASVFAFYVRSIRLQPGDVQELTVTAPDGSVVAQTKVPALDRGKAQYFTFVGRKRPAAGFPSGAYVGHYRVTNGERTVLTFEARVQM